MAAIDKIYGNKKQLRELKEWLKINCPGACIYLYNYSSNWWKKHKILAISNFPISIDRYLWRNCPLIFVKESLREQYNGNPFHSSYDDINFCVVCNSSINFSEALLCATCKKPFCWGSCGNWYKNERHCTSCLSSLSVEL